MSQTASGSTRQALTEEQRQQIIAKLLSERRSQAASEPRQAEQLPQEERAARLQELISRRAAAKQQHGHQPTQPLQQQHRQQQQAQQHVGQLYPQQALRQQHQHQPHAPPQRPHPTQQQQPRRPLSAAGSLQQEGSQDPLLSPGSAASMLSVTATAAASGSGRQHHHHQQQQQQVAALPQKPQQPPTSSSHSHNRHGKRSGFTAAVQQDRQAQPLRGPPGQQQQQRQRQQASRRQDVQSVVRSSALSRVLDGPVDISDLWASRASPTGRTSADDDGGSLATGDTGPSYSQGSGQDSALAAGTSCSSISDSGGDCSSGSQRAGSAYGAAAGDTLGWQGQDSDYEEEAQWQLSGSLDFAPVHQGGQQQQQQQLTDQQLLQQQQERLLQLRQLQDKRQGQGAPNPTRTGLQQLQQQPRARQQQQQQAVQYHRPSPPMQPRQQGQHLPASYPASRNERLQQLAQPKAAQRQKYEQMKAEAEQHVLQQCSFTPKTGRGPQHRLAPPGSVGERLHQVAEEKRARLEQKAARLANADVADCTFQPATNGPVNDRVLESYEYVPLHKRLGQVMRSRSEKLAHIQQQVEAEVCTSATFAPRINPRSSMLAARSRSCSRVRGGGGAAAGDRLPSPSPGRPCGTAPSSPCGAGEADGAAGRQDVSRGRSRERSARLRRTWSETGLSRGRSAARPDESACTFAPSINARSERMLQASGEIPLSFLQRQEYFDRLAREKKQLLQLAVEDAHCSFVPATATRSSSRSGRSDRVGSLDQEENFLDRIERLAYADKRRLEASRSVLADHVHASECTFRPAINPRSARMVKATPLQELYENSRGRLRRDNVALALEAQEQAECTFTPNLHKQGPCGAPPAEAKLNLSAEEVAGVVERLYSDPRAREARVGQALSYQQYQELKACTFKPEINRDVPKQEGPVLVRGLGRFLELKDMAKQQAEARAAVEAKVFITQPKSPVAPFTTPQPFRLGPVVPSGYEARRRRAAVEAEAALMGECTFQPRINSSHKTRQERVAELLAQH